MRMRITVDGTAYEVEVETLDENGGGGATPPVAAAASGGAAHAPPPRAAPAAKAPASQSASDGDGGVRSPAAGTVLSVAIKVGDSVAINDPLLVLEAMKMESAVVSPAAGTIAEVLVNPGEAVTAGQLLVRLN